MSYDYHDAEMEEAYDSLAKELYPAHKAQAIVEFTYARLRSYYLQNRGLLIPAARVYKSAGALLEAQQPAASLVFSVSAIELLLKACLLRPVVAGLVHSESLANLVVDSALSQTGFDRYQKLLAGLFKELTQTNLSEIVRTGATKPLLEEASALQRKRNDVIHRGDQVPEEDAQHAYSVAAAVFSNVLVVVLDELGLKIVKGGGLVDVEEASS